MAISGVIIGSLKTSLKKAAVKAAKEKVIGSQFLEEIASKTFTDTQAVILNRLKSYPNKALFEYIVNDTGLPISDIKSLLSNFNQTQKMVEIAKGNKFKYVAIERLSKELHLDKLDKIYDIIRKVEEINAFNKQPKSVNYNNLVYSLLTEIETSLKHKIAPIENPKDKFENDVIFDLEIKQLFNKSKTYNESNIKILESILKNMTSDIENYLISSGGEPLLVNIGNNEWEVYEEENVTRYIYEIKQDVIFGLS